MLVDGFEGHALSSPNDVVLVERRRDLVHRPELRPPAGLPPAVRSSSTPCTATTRVRASRAPSPAAFDKPNGLAFSPDEHSLYVTDKGARHCGEVIVVLVGDRSNAPPLISHSPTLLARRHQDRRRRAGLRLELPDRREGPSTPDGQPVGEIPVPGAVNFRLGGRDRNRLYITTDTAVWAAELGAYRHPE